MKYKIGDKFIFITDQDICKNERQEFVIEKINCSHNASYDLINYKNKKFYKLTEILETTIDKMLIKINRWNLTKSDKQLKFDF